MKHLVSSFFDPRAWRTLLLAFAAASLLTPLSRAEETSAPPAGWTRLVPVAGQPLPVPEQWLQDEEARIAHSLQLPPAVPTPVPFDFTAARLKALMPGQPSVALQYFDHLCATEAGQWIFRTVDNVEGLYFARPSTNPTSSLMADPYGPEMPWIERDFMLESSSAEGHGSWLVDPPFRLYKFVEEPHRNEEWQRKVAEPYVRLFGRTQEKLPNPSYFGKPNVEDLWYYYKKGNPMRVVGIARPSVVHGYTWRGITRVRDRENEIAGGEIIIYDIQDLTVLAIKRQFLITSRNRRNGEPAAWEIAARCPQLPGRIGDREFYNFALDVLRPTQLPTVNTK